MSKEARLDIISRAQHHATEIRDNLIEQMVMETEISFDAIGSFVERGADSMPLSVLQDGINNVKKQRRKELELEIPKMVVSFANNEDAPDETPKKKECAKPTEEGTKYIVDNKLTDEKRTEIIECGNAGYTVSETAKETNIAENIVRMVYQEEGIKVAI